MQKSEKFFIFSWKELLVIGLLVMTLIGFFFTLGLHYGKKLHPAEMATEDPAGKLEQSPESVPSKETLDRGAENAEPAAQDALKSATETAVTEEKLKLDHPKPTEFPSKKSEGGEEAAPAKSEKATGAKPAVKVEKTAARTEKTEKVTEKVAEKSTETAEEKAADGVEKPAGTVATNHFGVQLGSYTSKKEAQQKIAVFNKRGIKPEIRTAVVAGETRYRVVVPGFKNHASAEIRGRELRSKRKIENYIVIKTE